MKHVGLAHSAGTHDDERVVASGRLGYDRAARLQSHTIAGCFDQVVQLPER